MFQHKPCACLSPGICTWKGEELHAIQAFTELHSHAWLRDLASQQCTTATKRKAATCLTISLPIESKQQTNPLLRIEAKGTLQMKVCELESQE